MLKTEEEFSNKAPFFYEKLLNHKSQLSKRARKDVSNWWQLSEHRAWLRESHPRLISSEFGKSDSFAFDKKGVFAIERGNAWIPLSKYEKDFKNIDFYYFYLALFSSTFFDKLLSIYSKQLAGGNWYDLGKMHTGQIPIPNVNFEDVKNSDAYIKLVEIGKELCIGNSYIKSVSDDILIKYFYPEV
jgi:hypothetical protein